VEDNVHYQIGVDVRLKLEPSAASFGGFLQERHWEPVGHEDAVLLKVGLDLDQVVLGIYLDDFACGKCLLFDSYFVLVVAYNLILFVLAPAFK
jgi:hypothetical protein